MCQRETSAVLVCCWGWGGGVSAARAGEGGPIYGQHMNIIIGILIVWAVLAVLGFVIKGLLWLAVIALVLFAATVLWGMLKRGASSRS